VSTQVATPVVLVSGVHSWVGPVLNDTGWPLIGRPDEVSVAVRVIACCGLRRMRSVSVVGTRVMVWVSVLAEVA
jgi:hypothetical protein